MPRFLFSIILVLASCFRWTIAHPKIFSNTTDYPLPNQGNVHAHDPSIVFSNGSYYLFMTGYHIGIQKSSNLSGPWQSIGTVLSEPSVVHKPNNSRPWSPNVIEWDSKYYCFYSVSHQNRRNSGIGVAVTDNLDDNSHGDEKGSWTDHGPIIQTGAESAETNFYPYNESNALDPSFMADVSTHQPYLMFGSFWSDIWQVPLVQNLLSVEDPRRPDANHLVYVPGKDADKPVEGSFMSYTSPYYYLWFSHGKCCAFELTGFPEMGHEYVWCC